MVLLLGASGYIGHAFAGELRRRGHCFIPLTRGAMDYTRFELLFDYVRRMKPRFIINAAGLTGSPNVDACELAREEALAANTLLPQTVARVCLMTHTLWGHVSSGCIYSGAKVLENGGKRIEKNLNQPEFRRLLAEHPENVFGFTEWDEPNFSFRCPPCNFYSGTKVLAEEAIHGLGCSYIWRPGIPFSEREELRNLLWRLQRCPKVHDAVHPLSQVDDFVRACLNLWEGESPFGVYNVVNPGVVTTAQVVQMIQDILKPDHEIEFWKDDKEFYQHAARAPRSNCILETTKLQGAGVEMRPVEEALEDSLHNWQCVTAPLGMVLH